MKNSTQMETKLKELEIKLHINQGEVIALRRMWMNIHAHWLTAEKDCDRKEVEYVRLSRELEKERF